MGIHGVAVVAHGPSSTVFVIMRTVGEPTRGKVAAPIAAAGLGEGPYDGSGTVYLACGLLVGLFVPTAVVLVISFLVMITTVLPGLSKFFARLNADGWPRKVGLRVLLVWMGAIAIQLARLFSEALLGYLPDINNGPFRAVVLMFVLIAGWLAWRFKTRSLYYYGISEIGLGVLGTNRVIESTSGVLQFGDWIQILALTYLVSRGVGNCAEATKSQRVSP